MFFFFFSSRRRHTRCGRDWSSDVCSSDLTVGPDTATGDGLVDAEKAALLAKVRCLGPVVPRPVTPGPIRPIQPIQPITPVRPIRPIVPITPVQPIRPIVPTIE